MAGKEEPKKQKQIKKNKLVNRAALQQISHYSLLCAFHNLCL